MERKFYSLLILTLLITYVHGQEYYANTVVIQLDVGKLLIPSDFKIHNNYLNVFVHFHGRDTVVQDAFLKSKINGVLITIHLGMLSSPYKNAFSDSNYLEKILEDALMKLSLPKEQIPTLNLRLYLTSFSAGYAAIREILKYDRYYKMIKGLILLDGLHTDYVNINSNKMVNPNQMENFLKFALDACKCRKKFILTHSEIIPDGYSSTTETAQYLIKSTNTEIVFSEKFFDDDFVQKYYGFNGCFKVFGFYGNDAKAHMKHFYNLDKFLKMLSN
ncbi:MAG: hypothetical protein N3F03_06790 [Ignavibacteria bacterium]|nr:hypothetical protein [Ignavibacteria bacterium]